MDTLNNHSLCKQAELYYYDFLINESHGQIPQNIIEHLNQCQSCQEKINQLDIGLSSCGSIKSEHSQDADAMADLLQLHMAHIGNKVVCETVIPFLPVVLDPDFGISIPTPITVHLDHCPECAQDLETIKNLNLSRIQSFRLSQLLADKKSKKSISCSQAQAAIPAVSSMNFQETNAQVLKHLCTCCDCREALYQYRETSRTEYLHKQAEQDCSICNQLSTSDIFDYIVTYGLNPSDEDSFTFQDSITSHLQECPAALEKIQELHQRIYEIAERAESEVITIYHIDKFAKTQEVSESEDLYAGFPISVEIAHRKDKMNLEEPVPSIKFPAALKRKISALNVNPILKTGIVAVAVFLLGVTLFFRPSAAGALTIEQFYAAIDQIRNVHISTYASGKSTPTYEKWISHSFMIMEDRKGMTLWDFTNNQIRSKISGTTSVKITELSDGTMADVKEETSSSLGLIPYDQISKNPDNAAWRRLDDGESGTFVENTEIYELLWIQNDYGSTPVFWRWRLTVDSLKNLPQKVEFYSKLDAEGEYIPSSTIVIKYPDDHTIQAIINSFQM